MRMAPKFPCIAALGLGFLASCSDPVPPASQGSVSLHFSGPSAAASMAGKMCQAGNHYSNAPSAFDSAQYTTGTSRPKDTIVDGEQGRTLSCSVKPSGDKFVVNAQLNVPAFDKDKKPLLNATIIQLGTTIGKDESGATGSVVVSDNDTVATYTSSTCTYSVKADMTVNAKLAIDAGKIWGSVDCQDMGDPKVPSSSCVVSGYFVLENCDQ